jgi:hypothetical protein
MSLPERFDRARIEMRVIRFHLTILMYNIMTLVEIRKARLRAGTDLPHF